MHPVQSVGERPRLRGFRVTFPSMNRALFGFAALGSFVALGACAGRGSGPASAPAPTPSGGSLEAAALAAPDVALEDARGAIVGGKAVPVDGVAEGLAWPALRAAVGRKPGDHAPLTIAVARSVPMSTVMRAVWTLRDADLRLRTPDEAGTPHVIELRPKPETRPAASDAECHLAVFVAATGELSVATPGGPLRVTGPDASIALAHALASERARCTIRYVAFGAQSPDAPWSSIFDVARTVDRDKAAGDARYVLGEPVHLVGR
jgi:hypothetical protein